jgi:hypothetical protein
MLAQRFPTYAPVIEKTQQQAFCAELENQLFAAVNRRKTLSKLVVEADRRYQQELGYLELEIAQVSGELQYSLKKEARERTHVERILFEKTQELLYQQDTGQGKTQVESSEQISDDGMPDHIPELAEPEHDARHLPSISDWDELMQWRRRLDQNSAVNGDIPLSVEDLDSARQRYDDIQLSLEEQQRQAELQLEALKTDSESLSLVNSLRQEVEENEDEISALKRQQTRASENLMRYERVTRLRLIWLMLKTLLVHKLRASI